MVAGFLDVIICDSVFTTTPVGGFFRGLRVWVTLILGTSCHGLCIGGEELEYGGLDKTRGEFFPSVASVLCTEGGKGLWEDGRKVCSGVRQ